jgi:hypothetical protein
LAADFLDFAEILGILKRNGIFDEIAHPKPIDIASPLAQAFEYRMNPQDIDVQTETFYKLSQLGASFLKACRAPKKSNEELTK